MFESCLEKQRKIVELFSRCAAQEDKYAQLIEMGKSAPPFDPNMKIPENLVQGCQSEMYMHSEYKDGRVYFTTWSDALISAGLGALLVQVYNGETPETILKCPPDCIEQAGIDASLSPNRANGLYSTHLRMKQDALKYLTQQPQ